MNDTRPTPASVTPRRCHAFSLLSCFLGFVVSSPRSTISRTPILAAPPPLPSDSAVHTLGVAQTADALTPNSPFSLLFGEAVCILGATPVRQPAGRGELRHARVRHAGDTPQKGFAWRKTPTSAPASGTTAPDRGTRTPRNSGQVRHQLTMVRPNSEPPKARGHRRPRGNALSTAQTPNGSTGGTTV